MKKHKQIFLKDNFEAHLMKNEDSKEYDRQDPRSRYSPQTGQMWSRLFHDLWRLMLANEKLIKEQAFHI
jgi:hypothetical protein